MKFKHHTPSARRRLSAFALGSLLLFSPPVNAIEESDALSLLIQSLGSTDDSSAQAAMIKGILSGLQGQRDVQAPEAWNTVGPRLMASSDKTLQRAAQQLARVFGDESATRQALATLENSALEAETRKESFQSLLAQRNEDLVPLLPKLLHDSDLQIEAIRAYGVMPQATGGHTLLSAYPKFDNNAKRVALETLASRVAYAKVLLESLKAGDIEKQEIPTYVARSLESLLRGSFTKVYGDIRELGGDKKKQFARYKDLLTSGAMERGDASHGREIYERACAACHTLYGSGGVIGPDLTGSNRANLDYILLNILDPSDDIPENYRMVTITTQSGQVLVGTITEEDPQRLTLNAVGQKIVIAKSDIEKRVTSDISMMPEGLLATLKDSEVVDLIQYLRTEEQVEAHKH